jgi:hypothetical protein
VTTGNHIYGLAAGTTWVSDAFIWDESDPLGTPYYQSIAASEIGNNDYQQDNVANTPYYVHLKYGGASTTVAGRAELLSPTANNYSIANPARMRDPFIPGAAQKPLNSQTFWSPYETTVVTAGSETTISLIAIPYAGWQGQMNIVPNFSTLNFATGGVQSGLYYPMVIASKAVSPYKVITLVFDGSSGVLGWRINDDFVGPTTGSGVPGSTPTFVGQQYIDTSTTPKKVYIATATSSSSDWTVLN